MTFLGLTLSRIVSAGLVMLLLCPLLFAGAALSGVGHRWVDLLAQFTAAAFCAALLLTATAALFRLWPVTVVGAAVVCVTFAACWPQWFPPRGVAMPGAPAITLYSANLLTKNRDVEAIETSIAQAQADIVVLVETPEPVLKHLDRVLPRYPHRLVERDGRYAIDGTIIASRWPVHKAETLEGSNHVAAVVETPLGPVTIFAVHLTRPWPFQYQWGQITQTMSLDGSAKGVSGPLILAGDFNSVSSARIGRMIQRDLNVIAAPGWPGTWPSNAPSVVGMTIDQVYRSPDLALLGRRLGRPTGSDHRPVVTRLTLAKPQSRP